MNETDQETIEEADAFASELISGALKKIREKSPMGFETVQRIAFSIEESDGALVLFFGSIEERDEFVKRMVPPEFIGRAQTWGNDPPRVFWRVRDLRQDDCISIPAVEAAQAEMRVAAELFSLCETAQQRQLLREMLAEKFLNQQSGEPDHSDLNRIISWAGDIRRCGKN